VLYSIAGKPVPFLILSLICLLDGFAVFMVIQPKEHKAINERGEKVQGTPMWRLFMDPFIAVCSGALIMANISLAFLEPTITNWMTTQMPDTPGWMVGMIWFPPFFPHVLGVYFTVKMMKKFPQHPWILAAVGLALEGVSCLAVPFMTTVGQLIIPLSLICFGIALIDTSLLPMLAYLVDTRHVSVYGSVYAIADISYSMAYAFGPVIAGGIVQLWSFVALNVIICLLNVLYTPVIAILRKVYMYKPFENRNEMTTLPNNKDYGQVAGSDGYPQTAVNSYGTAETRYQNPDYPQPEYPAGVRPKHEESYIADDPLRPNW